jgi:hypothetical protein
VLIFSVLLLALTLLRTDPKRIFYFGIDFEKVEEMKDSRGNERGRCRKCPAGECVKYEFVEGNNDCSYCRCRVVDHLLVLPVDNRIATVVDISLPSTSTA